jgi:hypothetical protein
MVYGLARMTFKVRLTGSLQPCWVLWTVWVNRFANMGDAAVEVAGSTMERV